MTSGTLRIGVIVKPHGVRGAVKAEPLTDRPKRFSGMDHAYLELHGQLIPVRLSVHSVADYAVILHIEGYDSPEQAETLRGAYICVDRAEAIRLPKDSYFIADLIGCRAYDDSGAEYGLITDVYQGPANDVYVIEDGKLMVPALKKVLSSVDVVNKRIVFDSEVLKEVGLFED
ncbi:MAG TPA: ribosome maturation factor RimM [Eubacteriales bacterium]|mgnify:CR=1 FL=1|nr:ribosome maturation factor RimM [Clostridia bacterium]HRV72305.1 ribosome maturation factor RimM [Eubacteriales bacterium]